MLREYPSVFESKVPETLTRLSLHPSQDDLLYTYTIVACLGPLGAGPLCRDGSVVFFYHVSLTRTAYKVPPALLF